MESKLDEIYELLGSDEMEAKAILLKIVPKNCYWEDMENLTNTPIHYVMKAMQEYAQSESLKARNEALKTAESISFNTEDQAGNKFIAVDLNELKEKLKISDEDFQK